MVAPESEDCTGGDFPRLADINDELTNVFQRIMAEKSKKKKKSYYTSVGRWVLCMNSCVRIEIQLKGEALIEAE